MTTDTPQEDGMELRIRIADNGQMSVGWRGIPEDKTILYGILQTARDVIQRKFEEKAQTTGPRIIPAFGHRPPLPGNGRH